MKKKYILISIIAVLLLCAIAAAVWYHAPKRFLKHVKAEEVASVSVLCGSTGESFETTDAAEIAYIVTTIQNTKMERDNISEGYAGFMYRLNFIDAEGELIDTLILNSSTTIRVDPFFYRCEQDVLPFGYVTELYGKYVTPPAS